MLVSILGHVSLWISPFEFLRCSLLFPTSHFFPPITTFSHSPSLKFQPYLPQLISFSTPLFVATLKLSQPLKMAWTSKQIEVFSVYQYETFSDPDMNRSRLVFPFSKAQTPPVSTSR